MKKKPSRRSAKPVPRSAARAAGAARTAKPATRNGSTPPSTAERRRAHAVYQKLLATHPDAHCELNHRNAFELLIATILSAQCTDVRVNMVTPALFAKYPTPAAMAAADLTDLESLIRTTGFYRNKAKNIKGAAAAIAARHGGNVPDSMEALLDLPGVARKTANVVLGNAFGQNVGMVVDTHVARLSYRLGFTDHTDPVKIERDLMVLFPGDTHNWAMLAHLLIFHGRRICTARNPQCERCPLLKDCPQRGVKAPINKAAGAAKR